MVPLWVTLLVGLGGGLIGTVLTVGNQRGAEIRTRMLEAADDYLRTAGDVADVGYKVAEALKQEPRPTDAELDEEFAKFATAIDAVLMLHGRIQLLFGPDTATWQAVYDAYQKYHLIEKQLRAWRAQEPEFEIHALSAAFGEAGSAYDRFSKAAREDVRFGVAARLTHRLHR